MQVVPINITEKLMTLDILGVMRIDVSAGIISIPIQRLSYVSRSVSLRAKSVILRSNDAPEKVLAPSADDRLVRESKCFLVILNK